MKKAEVVLNEAQAAYYAKVSNKVKAVEEALAKPISVNNPEALVLELGIRLERLADSAELLAGATLLYDFAKGQVANLVLEEESLAGAKQEILKLYIQGKLAKYNALYIRVEAAVKDLRNSIDGIRSLLSYERELVRNNITPNL
jgi:hypothetical protein